MNWEVVINADVDKINRKSESGTVRVSGLMTEAD